MTTTADWQTRVGDVWAAEWRRTDRSFADLSRHLDAAILADTPEYGEALDIGCGAGATSLALAAARPGLTVTGVDLSPPMIAVADARAHDAGLAKRMTFVAHSIESLPDRPSFDLLVSRHGVMFFPNPTAVFSHLRALARAGAPLVFSCFAARAANRFATLADDLLGRPPEGAGEGPGPFAFADRDRVAALLAASGWQVRSADRVPFAYRAGEGADPVADAADFLTRVGPVASALREASADERSSLGVELAGCSNRIAAARRSISPPKPGSGERKPRADRPIPDCAVLPMPIRATSGHPAAARRPLASEWDTAAMRVCFALNFA